MTTKQDKEEDFDGKTSRKEADGVMLAHDEDIEMIVDAED